MYKKGQRVQVYRNLRKQQWSVRDAKTRKVIDHCDELYLEQCLLYVSESGRQRVLRDKRKNVHAWIDGIIRDKKDDLPPPRQITYNPYKYRKFVVADNEFEVVYAGAVFLNRDGRALAISPWP